MGARTRAPTTSTSSPCQCSPIACSYLLCRLPAGLLAGPLTAAGGRGVRGLELGAAAGGRGPRGEEGPYTKAAKAGASGCLPPPLRVRGPFLPWDGTWTDAAPRE